MFLQESLPWETLVFTKKLINHFACHFCILPTANSLVVPIKLIKWGCISLQYTNLENLTNNKLHTHFFLSNFAVSLQSNKDLFHWSLTGFYLQEYLWSCCATFLFPFCLEYRTYSLMLGEKSSDNHVAFSVFMSYMFAFFNSLFSGYKICWV